MIKGRERFSLMLLSRSIRIDEAKVSKRSLRRESGKMIKKEGEDKERIYERVNEEKSKRENESVCVCV